MIDLDPGLVEALERHTPAPAEDGDWECVVRDAGVARRRPRVRLALALAVVAAATLTGVSLLGGSPSTLDRARAAVTIEPGQVLHERILIAGVSGPAAGSAEVWIQGAAPHRYRLVSQALHGRHPGIPARTELSGTLDPSAPHTDTFDPRTNTIRREPFQGPSGKLPFDPATAIRRSLSTGKARVEGRRVVNGRKLVSIRITSLVNDGVGWGVGRDGEGVAVVLFDPKTYAPVQIEFEHLSGLSGLFGTPFFGGKLALVERFTAFRRLPATPANLRLTNVRALHPRAKCTIVGLSHEC